jgi:hypothetical protein
MGTPWKERIAQAVNGRLVRDWGVVSDRQPGFFRERICLALREQRGQPLITLTYKYSSRVSYTAFVFAIPVFDLPAFVNTMQLSYDRLLTLPTYPRAVFAGGRDALPFFHGLVLKLIHGVRVSMLLLDLTNPETQRTECRFYGYVTRKSDIKVFIQSDLDISTAKGHVISGDGLQAALQALAEYLREDPCEVAR